MEFFERGSPEDSGMGVGVGRGGSGSCCGGFLGLGCLRWADVAPTHLVALGGGAEFADLAFGGSFECPAAAHFLKDSLGVQLGLQALEGPVYWFALFEGYSTCGAFAIDHSVLLVSN